MISRSLISKISMISKGKGQKDPADDHSILFRTEYVKAQKLKIIASHKGTSVNLLLNQLVDILIEDWDNNEHQT